MKTQVIKELVDRATSEAEEKIRAILQEYHENTGMIPKSIGFHNIDNAENGQGRKQIVVIHVVLTATT